MTRSPASPRDCISAARRAQGGRRRHDLSSPSLPAKPGHHVQRGPQMQTRMCGEPAGKAGSMGGRAGTGVAARSGGRCCSGGTYSPPGCQSASAQGCSVIQSVVFNSWGWHLDRSTVCPWHGMQVARPLGRPTPQPPPHPRGSGRPATQVQCSTVATTLLQSRQSIRLEAASRCPGCSRVCPWQSGRQGAADVNVGPPRAPHMPGCTLARSVAHCRFWTIREPLHAPQSTAGGPGRAQEGGVPLEASPPYQPPAWAPAALAANHRRCGSRQF